MTRDFCLKGEAITQFRFLLEQDFPFQKAAQLAQNLSAFREVQKELMYAELIARNNPHRLAAVKNEFSVYSKEYRLTFEEAINSGHTLEASTNFAEARADTTTALSFQGNIARPATTDVPAQTETTEIYLGIIKPEYPKAVLKEVHFHSVRKELIKYIADMTGGEKPHFLECTWVKEFGYIRVVCADNKSANWLKGILPRLQLGEKASLLVFPEPKLRQAGFYTCDLADSVNDTIKDILGYFESQNSGFNITKWKVLARELASDQKTTKLLLSMPEDPDDTLLQNANCVLNYKFGTVKFTKPAITAIESKLSGCAAYLGFFPDSLDDTLEQVLKFLESQNEGLVTSEWVIAEKSRPGKDDKKVLRLFLIVDALSEEWITRSNKELNYKFSKIQLRPQSMRKAHSLLYKYKATKPKPAFRKNYGIKYFKI